MEFYDDAMRTFGKVLVYSLCFATVCIHSTAEGKALSQAPDPSSNKPTIYIDIPSWENRTAYPRFLIYRDHIRRRLESSDSGDNESSQISSYSKPQSSTVNSGARGNHSAISSPTSEEKYSVKESVNSSRSESEETDKDASESSSLEHLLQEQQNNGVIPDSHDKTDIAIRIYISNQPTAPNNANNFMGNEASDANTSNKQIIFPKDKTNPCNRLQINPDDDEETSSNESSNKANSQQEQVSAEQMETSIEIGNRENFSSEPDKKKEPMENISVELIKDAIPTFQLTMKIIEQSNWNDENVVFSPLSIANVLSMLLLGAGGETFKELLTQLDKHETSPQSASWTAYRYHEAYKSLRKYLNKFAGNGVTLTSASEIFVDKSFHVSERFQHELLNFYDAPLESFNFGKDGYVFMEKLNKWVREKTHNQIEKILEEPPSAATTMGIINAVYFNGPWEMAFSDKLTRWRDFRVQPKEKIKAQLMINILDLPYVERDLYRMTALPYKENKTALILILPKGNDGINDLKKVEKSLTREKLSESMSLMNETKVALTLPKLKITSDGEMVRILQNMGLSSVFNAVKANFSSISPGGGLYVSRLLHRAVVEINEKGTEASAVTLGTADRIIDDLPVPFGCDKPFLFYIYHIDADTILFWGRVVRP